MAAARASVLEGVSISTFVQYVLDKHSTTSVLIVCGTKETFAEQLQADVRLDAAKRAEEAATDYEAVQMLGSAPRRLESRPTLRLLSTLRNVRMVFCPDVMHLRAYLTMIAVKIEHTSAEPQTTGTPSRILAILDLVQLHRSTSAFSAQGLNRTFSAAVEAAFSTNSRLVVADCFAAPDKVQGAEPPPEAEAPPLQSDVPTDAWDEELSILNVTTKSFGVGERDWVGRTVKLRTVAQRWCVFEKLAVPSPR